VSVPLTPEDGKFRILIMETDADIAYTVVAALDKFGMECRHATDGNTGLTAFRAINPHLVVLDTALPGIDGWALCGKIRQATTIPILLLSDELNEEIYLKSFRIGADECIQKPFAAKILMTRVATHLRRVYRYDRAGEVAAPTVRPSAIPKQPPGWGTCEDCGYMGPTYKFENESPSGKVSRACPNCKRSAQIAFTIG